MSIRKPSEIDVRSDEHFTHDGESEIDAALWLRILDKEAAKLIDSEEQSIERSN
jgi:hypothetical protein